MEEEVLITKSPLEIELSSETLPSDIAEQILIQSKAKKLKRFCSAFNKTEIFLKSKTTCLELLKRFSDCEVATFSLPHWYFEKEKGRKICERTKGSIHLRNTTLNEMVTNRKTSLHPRIPKTIREAKSWWSCLVSLFKVD